MQFSAQPIGAQLLGSTSKLRMRPRGHVTERHPVQCEDELRRKMMRELFTGDIDLHAPVDMSDVVDLHPTTSALVTNTTRYANLPQFPGPRPQGIAGAREPAASKPRPRSHRLANAAVIQGLRR